ncbi:diguanylate cyclase [Lacrimispora sp. 38-1]|uniref:GGDEF domain-containing protein n=1 Tax=Lacrimispora sp. 38-1 TaxID=3125778 RepID=UPI003CE8DB32
MAAESNETAHVNEIQKEYTRIDKDWLSLHYKISIGMVLFALAVECIMGVILVNSDMLHTTVWRFVFKFILVPSSVNALCIAVDHAVVKSRKISQTAKIYTVSIINTVICFTLFTAHSAFAATYYVFVTAVILTTVYASSLVTLSTSVIGVVLLLVSELFITWDVDKPTVFQSTLRLGNFLIALFVMFFVSIICMVVIRYEQRKNRASIRIEEERILLKKRLKMDELTGIYNRKALHDAMRDLEDCNPCDSYVFGITDIDKFKNINDSWGHQTGDKCLTAFAELLKNSCEKAVAYRYGGDEFCLIFYNTDMKEAYETAVLIQNTLKQVDFKEHPGLKLTASFGLAEYQNGMNAARLFLNADQALYQAKITRDAIRIHQEEK